MAFAVSRQEGERGTRNRKTEGRTDESERTRSWRRITGTADEDGREERAREWTVEGNRQKRGTGKRTRRAGCQTVEELPCCWSLGGDVVARCGDDIDQKRTRWPPVHLPER